MKFCIFSANYLPNIGGVERYTYYISKELIKNGHSVTVVTSNVFNLEPIEITPEGIELCRLPCYSLMGGRYPVYKKNAAFKKIDRHIRSQKYDLVIVNTRFYFHSLYGAKFANECNTPVITIEHGTSHLTVNNRVLDYFGEKWEHFITNRLKKYCTDYYGVSEAACEWSAHFGIKSKGTLYNSIDLNEIETLLKNPILNYREQLGIDKSAKIVVFTGRLVKEKGVCQLLDAFNKLNLENTYLIFAGDGPERQYLENSKNKNTILLGKLDFPHIIALLSTSDILCLPSVSEGMSTSVLEAAATKTFVITTESGGSKELIAGPEYGIVTKSNTVKEVYDSLQRALQDDMYRKSAVENSYTHLKQNFIWQKTASVVENICKSMGENE